MKSSLYILGLLVAIAVSFGSCKENTLDQLRENELQTLDNYVKINSLTTAKDSSGIYFVMKERSTDTTLIRSGFKAMLHFTITLIDSTVVFTTEDGEGHTYEEFPFYVDVSNTTVNAEYVQQIAGLHKGLKKMHIGDTAFMVIPSELAFKAVDNSALLGIPRFSTLLATVYIKQAYSPEQLADQ